MFKAWWNLLQTNIGPTDTFDNNNAKSKQDVALSLLICPC